ANTHPGPNWQAREASTKLVENTLSWIKGSHSVQLGGSWTRVDLWQKNQSFAPTVTFWVHPNDPAEAMFTQGNFPGASTAQLNDARELYATLVGRVNAVTANARLDEETDEYQFLGLGTVRPRMHELGLFAHDSWRMNPNLTVNFGLRYELQLPFHARNNAYSYATLEDVFGVSGVGNLFKPGVMTGRPPQFIPFEKGTHAYTTDRNNFAPNLGVAWTPNAKSGLFQRILGAEGDSVFRAGYSLAYNRPGTNSFSGEIDDNPGVVIDVNRDLTLGNLGPLPLLFRNRDRLTPPAFPLRRQYPLTDVITADVHIFDPKLNVPYAQTWTAGWQRKITRDTAVEVRYVGTRHLGQWEEHNFNEINLIENGFLDEF
ncbi:MAG: TonB-dependent receptor domain-containing protein, partial [Acidimicrobiia bacterium]